MTVQPKHFRNPETGKAEIPVARRDTTEGLIEYELEAGDRIEFSFSFERKLPVYPGSFVARRGPGLVDVKLDDEHRGVIPREICVHPEQIRRA